MNGRLAKKVRKESRRLAKTKMGQQNYEYRIENLNLKKTNKDLIKENEALIKENEELRGKKDGDSKVS